MPAREHSTDEELLTQLRLNNEAAFTVIYNRYWEKLLATALYFTHDQPVAEEIVHDVFISLWTRRNDLSIQSLSSYLAIAVKFAVFKSIARDKRRRQMMHDYVPNREADVLDQLDAKFTEELLLQKTHELSPKARLVFDYSRRHELTVAEIAGKLNLSPKAVEYHITRAIRLLRNAFKKINLFFL